MKYFFNFLRKILVLILPFLRTIVIMN